MAQKIIKIGKSAGITLPKTILEKLGAKTGEEVVVDYNEKDDAVTVKRHGANSSHHQKIATLTDNFVEQYRGDLEELAKK